MNSMVSYMPLDVVACESRDGCHADTGAVQDRSVKRRMRSKALPNSAVPFCLTSAIQSYPGAR